MASHGSPTWTVAVRGTVLEAEVIGAAAYLLQTPPSACTVHVVDASIIGAHLRRAQEAQTVAGADLTSGQPACIELDSGVAALATTQSGGPHHWVVRQSSYLAAVLLEEPDSAAARAMAPPVHHLLPKEHAVLLVPRDDGELKPQVPPMQAFHHSGRRSGAGWRCARGPISRWLAPVRQCPWERCTTVQRTGIC